jgi:cytochrome b
VPGSRHQGAAGDGRILVWDVAVRLLHWMLAGLVIFDLVHDDGDWTHRMVGYAAVVVVAVRFAWSALMPGYAGFAALKPSLVATLSYLRSGAPRTVGHDPLGLWMVWLLWSLVLLLGLTGWMSHLDAFWGDETVRNVHAWLANAILVGVGLHAAGVAVMGWRWRENLVAAMFTGRKREP